MSTLNLISFTPLNSQTKKKVITIWKSIYDSHDSFEFRNPVDWKGLGLLDYLKYVSQPMDLNTISKKLRQQKYRTVQNVLNDIQLIFDNCKTYNTPGSWIYNLAQKLQSSFIKMIRNFIPRIIQSNPKSKINPNYLKQKQISENVQQIMQQEHNFYIQEVSYNDKIKFTDKLSHINSENLQCILRKILTKSPKAIKIIQPEVQQIQQKINLQNQEDQIIDINNQKNQIQNPVPSMQQICINNEQIICNPQQHQVPKLQQKLNQHEQNQNKMQIQQNNNNNGNIIQQKPRRGRRARNSIQPKITKQQIKQKQNNQNSKIILDKMQIGTKAQICIDDLSIQNFEELMKMLQGMVQQKDRVMKKIKLD